MPNVCFFNVYYVKHHSCLFMLQDTQQTCDHPIDDDWNYRKYLHLPEEKRLQKDSPDMFWNVTKCKNLNSLHSGVCGELGWYSYEFLNKLVL